MLDDLFLEEFDFTILELTKTYAKKILDVSLFFDV